MKEYLLGIDIGTQVTKGALVRPSGEIVATATEEYGVLHPQPLWAEQWPQIWLDAVCKVTKEILAKLRIPSEQIAGVCISGLYGGSGIPMDEKMRPIRPCIIWMDRRATREVEWVKTHVDLDLLFKITGNWVDTYYGYTKILWIKHNEPENWKKTKLFLPPNSYVNFVLTGEIAIDHSSAGNLGGVYDIRARKWSETMAQALGIPLELLPERIVPSAEIVGEISQKGSKLTGLSPGTPVLAGGIDAAMATLAAGALDPGDNVAMIGTSTCWGIIHDGENFAKELVSMPHVIEPLHKVYTWGGSATSGALIRWFRDNFGFDEDYKKLDTLAEAVPPGSEGLVALPYFMGERAPLWDSDARGAWVGLTLSHGKGHLFRALLEATAFALRQAIEVGVKIGLPLKDETIVVGGAAKSPLWLKIIANVTGRPIRTISTKGIDAPLADALLVGLATGVIKNHRIIKDWVCYIDQIVPDSELVEIYSRYYDIYRELYKSLQRIFLILKAASKGSGSK